MLEKVFTKLNFSPVSFDQLLTSVFGCFEMKIRPQACNFTKKETLAQVFSCEFYEISKNTFLDRNFRWPLLYSGGKSNCVKATAS